MNAVRRCLARAGGVRRPIPDSEEAGFTLAEVLVAFAIASLGTIVALETSGMTVSGIRRLETARVALDEAEGVALRYVATGPLRPGLAQGTFSNGTVWTLRVTDARPAYGQTRIPPLYLVRVTRGGPAGEPLYTTLVAGERDG